ncbi:hypothetical protein [Pedobacter psychrodurus]|uniref:hypothetical protein n=1 Tax=Pedobacter psychrodurus TaxID=2530456 RepID=UPI0029308069|nr:hypothetical protein [Pedobacter psychrodurus]
MKTILILLLLLCQRGFSQRIILDRDHLKAVMENNAARISAELFHIGSLEDINGRQKEISRNLGAVILTEQLIFSSLTQVDQGLKSAMAVRQIGQLSLEIISESRAVLGQAAAAPYLLAFAEATCRQLSDRGLKLAGEVSVLILKEGKDLLIDFAKRDALLKKISLELKTIRALLFSIKKCMYWARVKGVLHSVNPFGGFVNTDKRMVENLLLDLKTLKQK